MKIPIVVKSLLIINIVFYVLTYWITPMMPLDGHKDWFLNFNILYPIGIDGFSIHQYVTYMFLHADWWHLFFNMWSLMIFGCAVEQLWGAKKFIIYYMVCGVGSALFNQLLAVAEVIPLSYLYGASGAVFGVMVAAAFHFPDTRLFVIPIPFPIKLKYLVMVYAALEIYFGTNGNDLVAHFAHVGGILVGLTMLLIWKYMDKRKLQRGNEGYWTSTNSYNTGNYTKDDGGLFSRMKGKMSPKRTPKMRVTTINPETDSNAADHEYNARKKADNDEIDRILDKIRKSGYQNLTEKEKATLFEASNKC